jgi:hypothetical protein
MARLACWRGKMLRTNWQTACQVCAGIGAFSGTILRGDGHRAAAMRGQYLKEVGDLNGAARED